MNINQIKDSKFLKKEDCGKGILVTIESIDQQNVAMQGEPEELRYVLHFREDIKPMILNTTNAKLIAHALGSEETDEWHGHQIVLYNDPTIMFGGKMIGGIRARAPKPAAKPAAAPAKPAPAPAPEPNLADDEEVPF